MQGGHRRLVQILVLLSVHARFIQISDNSVQKPMNLTLGWELEAVALRWVGFEIVSLRPASCSAGVPRRLRVRAERRCSAECELAKATLFKLMMLTALF